MLVRCLGRGRMVGRLDRAEARKSRSRERVSEPPDEQIATGGRHPAETANSASDYRIGGTGQRSMALLLA